MNIFITVGTGKFDALIKEIDTLAPNLNHNITAQIGKGKYIPKNITFFRFKSSLQEEYQKANLIIAHAGAGTTYEILAMNKKLISIANLERTDHHQLDIVKKFSQEGYLVWCKDLKQLTDCIQKLNNITFKKYQKPKCTIAETIQKYVHYKNKIASLKKND